MPWRNTKRGSAVALRHQVSSPVELLHSSRRLLAAYANSDSQGWKGMSASIRRLTLPVSSWPISLSLWTFRSARIFLGENGVYYTIFRLIIIGGKKQNRLARKGKTARCHAHIYWLLRLYIFPEVQPVIILVYQVLDPANAFPYLVLAKRPSAHSSYLHFILYMTGYLGQFHL